MSVTSHNILGKLSATRLPTISQVLVRLLALCQDDRASVTELAKLIWRDPSMAQKILSVGNSSAYAHTGPHVRLETALMAMGTDMVRMLIINESIFQNFQGLSRNQRLDLRAFWHHSLTTAMIAHNMALFMRHENADKAYLAGLLHDIGRLALMSVAPEKYAQLFYRKDDDALCIMESNSLGISHADAGAWLIRYWKLDEDIAESVEKHHGRPEQMSTAPMLDRIVFLANQLAYCDENSPQIRLLADRFGIALADMHHILSDVHEQVQLAAEQLGIDISDIVLPANGKEEEAPPEPAPSDQIAMSREILNLLNSAEFGRFFARQSTPAGLQQAAILAACNILRLRHALLFWYNPATDRYTCLATDAPSHKFLGISIPAHASSIINQVATEKEPRFPAALEELGTAAEKNLASLIGNTSWVLFPLSDDTTTLGVVFGSQEPEQTSSLQEKKWLIKNLVEQFIFSWYRLQETRKHIQEEVSQIEEKYRHISRAAQNDTDSPLTIIRNYLQILNRKIARENGKRTATTVLQEEISRLEQILSDMATPPDDTASADLMAVTSEMVILFRETNPEIIINESSNTSLKSAPVCIPEHVLRQVFLNLLRGAGATMPDGGEIAIIHEGKKERDARTFFALTVRCRNTRTTDTGSTRTPVEKNDPEKQLRELDMGIVYSLLSQFNALIASHSDINGTIFDILIPIRTPRVPRNGPFSIEDQ